MVSYYSRFMLLLVFCISIKASDMAARVYVLDDLPRFDRVWLQGILPANTGFDTTLDNKELTQATALFIAQNGAGAAAQTVPMPEPEWTAYLLIGMPWQGDVASLTDIQEDGIYHIAGSGDWFFAYNNGKLLPAKNTAEMLQFLRDFRRK